MNNPIAGAKALREFTRELWQLRLKKTRPCKKRMEPEAQTSGKIVRVGNGIIWKLKASAAQRRRAATRGGEGGLHRSG